MIKQHRQAKGFTQETLSKLSGVSRSSIASYESEHQNLSLQAFAAVCYSLKMSPEEIGRVVLMTHLKR
jgi:transcriptional regulator with XRE-family HTH domain